MAFELTGSSAADAPLALQGPVPSRDEPPLRLDGVTSPDRCAAIRRRNSIFRRALAIADALSAAAVVWTGAVVLGGAHLTAATPAAILLLILVMKSIGLYDRDENRLQKTTIDELPALFQVSTLSALLLWLGSSWLFGTELRPLEVLAIWGLLFVSMGTTRSIARLAAREVTPPERCLVLGSGEAAESLRREIEINTSVNAEVVGWLPAALVPSGNRGMPLPEQPADLQQVLSAADVHRVILAPGRVDSDTLLHLTRRISACDVAISVLPATPPMPGSLAELDGLSRLPLLGVRRFEMTLSSRILKRGFDAAASAAMLLVLSPLLLVIAAAIKLDSPGPVLFRQRRIGRGGTEFQVLKFRSMYVDAEQRRDELLELNEADGLFKIEDDPRVTVVGRWLRRWSLDELPQLVNVLRGEMNLVGPRPLIPEEDARVDGHYRRRLDVAPGITGYWQALGASRVPLREMVRLDYQYVSTWTLWNDIKTLFRTIPYVVGRRGR